MKRRLSVRNGWVWRGCILGILILFAGFPVNSGQAAKSLSVSQPGIASGWLQSRPDAPLSFYDFSQHALKLDPVGTDHFPRIAYGGDHLYYAYQDSGGWHTVTVDNAWDVGSGAALALDSGGYAHISYYDSANGDLKYATNKGGSWQISLIASNGWVGRYSDIAIDFTDNPSIVYYNSTTSELHYINFDPEVGWTADEVVVTGVYDYFSHPGWFSLAMDPIAYKPHVSYYKYADPTHGTLEWAHYADNTFNWVHSGVEFACVPAATTCKLGEYNSIALDPSTHRPSIAYSYYDAYSSDTIWYSAYNGTNWVDDQTPASGGITYLSLGIDTTGYAHIAWNGTGLKYSHQISGGTWDTVTNLDTSATAGKPVSLAVIGTLAKVAYYNPGTGILAYKNHDRSGWFPSTDTIATQGHDVGRCSSLSIDTFGRANISYHDETNQHLLYARYSGSAWSYLPIDTTGNADCFSVVVANPANGDPTVAYISGGNLYYRPGNGTSWVAPILVDTGIDHVYDYQTFSMAIDSDGRPHIVYRKGGNLWYGVYSTSWTKIQIATGTSTGYVALAIGPDKQPQVAFYQSSALKYRRLSDGIWQTPETIAATGSSGPGVGVAMVADKNNLPSVAFLNNGGTDLRVSSRSAGGIWTMSALLDGDAEEYFSLAIDSANNLHLAAATLVTGAGSQLHYHTRKGGTWTMLAVDTLNGNMGYPSISLAPDGLPRISYYDPVSHDLLYILKLNQTYLPLLKR